jgi:hypothetical protein
MKSPALQARRQGGDLLVEDLASRRDGCDCEVMRLGDSAGCERSTCDCAQAAAPRSCEQSIPPTSWSVRSRPGPRRACDPSTSRPYHARKVPSRAAVTPLRSALYGLVGSQFRGVSPVLHPRTAAAPSAWPSSGAQGLAAWSARRWPNAGATTSRPRRRHNLP